MSFTIPSALQWWQREIPDNVALCVDGETITFAELWDWSGRIGHKLVNEGVMPGDRLVAVAINSLEYAVYKIALVRIGAVSVPLSFRSAAREVKEFCEEMEPVRIFCDDDRLAVVSEAVSAIDGLEPERLESLRVLQHGEVATIDHDADPDAAVFIIGTSGSTSRPKGVIYTNRTIVTYASEFILMEPRCGKGSSVLSCGPFSSSSGSLLLMQFLVSGVSMYIESQYRPQRALELLVNERITTMQAAPIFFEQLAALDEFASADLSEMHFAQVGGAPVADALLNAWRDKGVILRQAYGSTEAGGGWAARDDTALSEPQKCGRGGLFTEYAIRSDDGAFAQPGTAGEVLIRTPCMSPGYWRKPDETEEAFRGGWFHTGDLGVMDERGNLQFIDRIKDIVITGGLNVSTAELERVIRELEGLDDVAVIGVPDDKFGETPMAIVHGRREVTVERIIDHCNRNLSSYKVPRYVVIEQAPLPRLPSGKIDKKVVRQRYRDVASRLDRVR